MTEQILPEISLILVSLLLVKYLETGIKDKENKRRSYFFKNFKHTLGIFSLEYKMMYG